MWIYNLSFSVSLWNVLFMCICGKIKFCCSVREFFVFVVGHKNLRPRKVSEDNSTFSFSKTMTGGKAASMSKGKRVQLRNQPLSSQIEESTKNKPIKHKEKGNKVSEEQNEVESKLSARILSTARRQFTEEQDERWCFRQNIILFEITLFDHVLYSNSLYCVLYNDLGDQKHRVRVGRLQKSKAWC